MTKASTLSDANAFTAWVRSIAVNRCLMALRSPWAERRDVFDEDLAVPPGPDRADGLLDMERALARLAAGTRAVLWLHDVEGYTHQEIGKLLGRSTSFSKSQLSRGYRKLERLRFGAPAPMDEKRDEDNLSQPHPSL